MEKANPKIFDRSAYSSTTISVFQIVGAYFVDVYYNHLYTEAIKFKTDGKVASVTEGYRHATFAFLTALDNKAKGYKPEHYNKLIQGINEYFVFWTTYSSLTLSECIDKIVREFIPADYFASLNKEQKRNILRSVLIESIREFTKIVIGEFLGAIIDNHDEPANVEALKEKMVDTFIMQRETMFHKFLDCRAGGRPDEKVDKKFVDKLRTEVIRLNQQNQELITANKNLNEQLETVKASAEEVVRRFKLLKNKYDAITQEYRISKEKAKDLEEALNARRATFGTSLSTSIFDDDVPENMDSKLEDKSEDENPVQVLVSKPISQTTQAKPAQSVAPTKTQNKPVQSATTKPNQVATQVANKPVNKKQPAVKPPVNKPAVKPATQPAAKPSQLVIKDNPKETPITKDEDTINEDTDDDNITDDDENNTPEITKEIRIPAVAKKKEELPPKNEMDEALARHIVPSATDTALSKPPSISDIY